MDEKRFWDIIAAGCPPDDPNHWPTTLVSQLKKLPLEEILLFDWTFDGRVDVACRMDLWAVAFIINGGCTFGNFIPGLFGNWLVGMGKKVYESALANPDSLADIVHPGRRFEADLSPGVDAWMALGLDEEEFYARYVQLGDYNAPVFTEEIWDYNDRRERQKRFPKLTALYDDG